MRYALSGINCPNFVIQASATAALSTRDGALKRSDFLATRAQKEPRSLVLDAPCFPDCQQAPECLPREVSLSRDGSPRSVEREPGRGAIRFRSSE
jgi:hypothetical protein